MHRIQLTLIIIASLALAGCGSEEPPEEQKPAHPERGFFNENHNVGFNPPAGWIVNQTGIPAILVQYTPLEKIVLTKISLVVGKISTAVTAADALANMQKKDFKDAAVLESGVVELESGKAAFMVLEEKDGEGIRVSRIVLALVGDKAAILTCSTQKFLYEKHKAAFEKCCKSLWLGSGPSPLPSGE